MMIGADGAQEATVSLSFTYAAVLVVLVLVAAAAAAAARLGVTRAVVVASLRALAQLAVVSLLIVVVLRSWGLTAAFVVSMLVVAAFTSAQRIGGGARSIARLALPIAGGTAPVFGLITLTGTVPRTPIAVVPIAGILIGGAMTATTLAGRRALDTLRTRYGEYEAALALGFGDRDAALELCRPSAAEALLPALDQTRTVGLVTLPGAFVGVLLGGATPVEAGAAQLLVLVGLLAAETVAAVLTVELVARRHITWGRTVEPATARLRVPRSRSHDRRSR